MSNRIVTGEVRLSYANIWEPKSIQGSDPKYSCSLLIPKNDTKTVDAIQNAIKNTLAELAGKFGGKVPPLGSLKLPLRDGDAEKDTDTNPEYAGMLFLNANNKTAPQIVERSATGGIQPILDQNEVYSGCYAQVSIEFFAFNSNGNKGVGVALGNILKTRDGESLGGGAISAEADFGGLADAGRGGFGQTDDDLLG
ncbi:DUF2815 family protein [Corynebacterium striatum]